MSVSLFQGAHAGIVGGGAKGMTSSVVTSTADNGLPQISVLTSKVVPAKQDFSIVASAWDPDGEPIGVAWTILSGSATTAVQWVNSPTSGSSIQSTLTFPGHPAGTMLRFQVSAWETANPSRTTSKVVTVTVVANPPPGGGSPTSVQDGTCTPDALGPPQIVPNQYGGLVATPGDTVAIWVTLRDTSTTIDVWGMQATGPVASLARWDYDELGSLGAAQFSPVVETVTGDQASLKFILQFRAPTFVPDQKVVNIFLTVPDQKGCAARVIFPITLIAGGTHPPPEFSISSFPDSVRVGQTFNVDATVDRPGDEGPYAFDWSMLPEGNGEPILSTTSGSTGMARFVAPSLDDLSGGFVTVRADVAEPCATWSDSVDAVIALEPASLDFSQVAAGPFDAPGVCDDCRIETVVALINPAQESAAATAQEGDQSPASGGSPADGWMDFHEGTATSTGTPTIDGDGFVDGQGRYVFQIPAGGGREYTVQSDSLWVGWLSVESSRSLVGHLFYRYVDSTGKTVAEIPVLPIRARSATTVLSKAATNQVGLAIANLSVEPVEFQVVVDDGIPVPTREIPIGPKGHLAMNLTEIYQQYSPASVFPPGFHGGTLRVKLTSGAGPLALTVIKLDDKSLPLAILPVSVE